MKLFYTLLTILITFPIHAMHIELSDPQYSQADTTRLFHCLCQEEVVPEQLRALLLVGQADPNAMLIHGDKRATCLEYTLQRTNAIELMRPLIDNGADINRPKALGSNGTILHSAAIMLHEEKIAFLLEKGADTNALWDSGSDVYTPVTIVCSRQSEGLELFPNKKRIALQTNILRRMLQAGGKDIINERLHQNYKLPLEQASFSGQYFLIPTLLEHGARIECSNLLGITMRSDIVYDYIRNKTIRALLDAGANPYKKDPEHGSFLFWNKTDKSLPYTRWKKQHKPMREKLSDFISKATSGSLCVVTRIPQPNNKPRVGASPTLPALPLEVIACILGYVTANLPWTHDNQLNRDKKKHLKQELRELAKDKDLLSKEDMQQKIQALCALKFPDQEILGMPTSHWIFKQTRCPQILQLFIDAGVQRNAISSSLLHTALQNNRLTSLLLKYFNTVNGYGRTFFGFSAFNKTDNTGNISQTLIESGADIHATTQLGETMLHLAARNRNRQMMQFFINHGLPIDAHDTNNNTPLHDYLMHNKNTDDTKEILELFFAANAPFDIQNNDGQDCLALAEKAEIPLLALYKEWDIRTHTSLSDKAKSTLKGLGTLLGKKKE